VSLSATELERYSRHVLLAEVGRAGQEKLRAARVLIVGAGGLGSPAALYLAASGVGTLGIVDGDHVDLSNLQRQILFSAADVGQPKALAASRRLGALNPEIAVVAHALELRADNVGALVRSYDLVIDGTDRTAVRYLVNDVCVILGKPLVSAAIHRFEGQAMTYVPGRGPCYRCLFPDANAAAVTCAEAGVLGVLPGVLGVIQATEGIKLILSQGEPLVGRLLTYDALEMRFREFPFARRTDCAVCGDTPRIASLADALAAYPDQTIRLRRLAPRELAELIKNAAGGGPSIRLIDVREPAEFAAGHLAGSESVPLGELDRDARALTDDGVTVFMCRSGARSVRACAIASRRGLMEPMHLEGGLVAWAAMIDPTLHVA
jgi:molybdopterin/thiamine biosynthesis adenylyltransferase/rhodanese-related sulfurtransferase